MSEQLVAKTTDIEIDSERGRQDFSNIGKLVESIERFGVLQPVVVAKGDKKPWKLVAGERRYKANLMAGRSVIPITPQQDASPLLQKEIELEENLQRENLNWDETCTIMKQIHDLKTDVHGHAMKGKQTEESEEKKGWSIHDTATLAGISPAWAGEQIKFAKEMEKRPDLAKQVKHLPVRAAMKQFKKLEAAEDTKRKIDQGYLKITSELVQGDCISIMGKMEKETVDLILCDPPFGLDELDDPGNRGETQSYMNTLMPTDNMDQAAVRNLVGEMARVFGHVLKPTAHFYIFGKMEMFRWVQQRMDSTFKLKVFHTPLVWDKGRATTPFRGYTYAPSYEIIIHGWKEPTNERRMNSSGRDILYYKPLSSQAKDHPFEKPQDLLEYLITQSSSEGDLVLDPFAGSGSTILAARASRRRGLGIEIDDGHYHRAMAKLGTPLDTAEPKPEPVLLTEDTKTMYELGNIGRNLKKDH